MKHALVVGIMNPKNEHCFAKPEWGAKLVAPRFTNGGVK